MQRETLFDKVKLFNRVAVKVLGRKIYLFSSQQREREREGRGERESKVYNRVKNKLQHFVCILCNLTTEQ